VATLSGAGQTEEIFSNSTGFIYQPLSNFTSCLCRSGYAQAGNDISCEGLRHPEEVRAILNPKLNHEMVKFTQKLVA